MSKQESNLSKLTRVVLLVLAMSSSAMASTIAIIDSGTDMQHKDIAPYAWTNPVDNTRNDRDEDDNGYQDDIYGWNFAENNSEVIDYSYLGTLTSEIVRFFDIQTSIMLGLATQQDITWIKEKVKDEEFLKTVSIYANFMHGTHVAGISIKGNEDADLMAIKLIPTEVKVPGREDEGNALASLLHMSGSNLNLQTVMNDNKASGVTMFLLKQLMGKLAAEQRAKMTEIASYVDGQGADIANGSFGTGWQQAQGIARAIGGAVIKDITDEQVDEIALHFMTSVLEKGNDFVAAAPKTLFVFAAGNDASNNDKFPTSPTNIVADNVISVAATIRRLALASFSNFGEEMVDVAAPGVGIESSVPGDKYLSVSGTSQAAPYVSKVAGLIKDTNPALTPKQIKEILMQTVDKKPFLIGKVKSQGIVNDARAIEAAKVSLSMPLNEAIASAKESVSDIKPKSNFTLRSINVDFKGFVLPLPNSFVIKN